MNLTILAVLVFLSGCSSKEFQTTRYFDALTKDEVLEAGKLVFFDKDKYIIDSYRNRLEVTKIGIVFHTLTHEDFVLNVEENECGTNATLKMTSNYGVDKVLNNDAFELEHRFFWYQVESILEDKKELLESSNDGNEVENKTALSPQKDLSQCVIKTEFENGVIKNKTSSIGEIDYEDL